MKIKSLFDDYVGEATLVADHELSDGPAVLVLEDGEAVPPGDSRLIGWQLAEATDEERMALREAGYMIPDTV